MKQTIRYALSLLVVPALLSACNAEIKAVNPVAKNGQKPPAAPVHPTANSAFADYEGYWESTGLPEGAKEMILQIDAAGKVTAAAGGDLFQTGASSALVAQKDGSANLDAKLAIAGTVVDMNFVTSFDDEKNLELKPVASKQTAPTTSEDVSVTGTATVTVTPSIPTLTFKRVSDATADADLAKIKGAEPKPEAPVAPAPSAKPAPAPASK